MADTPIDLPAGVVKRDSNAVVAGRYTDTQWARFRDGKPEKIGGWQSIVAAIEAAPAIVRGMLGWTSRGGADLVAAGTQKKLYSIAASKSDITPARATGTLANDPFNVSVGSAVVIVTHTAHGLETGATAVFSGASAGGGITIVGAYVITKTDADHYTITHSVAGGSSDSTTGGAAVAYVYEINPGLLESLFEDVYLALSGDMTGGSDLLSLSGDMTDGDDVHLISGDLGRFGVFQEMRYWSFDTYGDQLLALPSGGVLYEWDQPSADPRAIAVSGSPTARAMFVTTERFPIMLGSGGDPMKIAWPDQDDITDWTPVSTNTANTRTLQGGSKLMNGTTLADRINLIWSDDAVFLMQYTGSDFVYDTLMIADGAGLMAVDAFSVAYGAGYWMSKSGFLMYRGGVAPIPNSEEVRDYVLANINKARSEKIWSGYNPQFNEIWWGYPSLTADEPDRYVAVSLNDFKWFVGALERTAASHHSSATGGPVMADFDTVVYRHESGLDGAGLAIDSYIETGRVALKGTGRDMDGFRFVPDFQRQVGDLELRLRTYARPMSTDVLETNTHTIAEGQDEEDLRLEGRYIQMRLRSNEIGGDYRLGVPIIDTEPGGER